MIRIIKEFRYDRACGGTFWDTFNRKFRHTLFSHCYELWSIRPYYKSSLVLNVGAGRDSRKLGENVISLDCRSGEDEYTEKLRWKPIRPNIICDMHNISCDDNCYDTVMAMHVLEHTDRPQDLLREFFRVTKPGGYIALILPCGAGNHYWHYIKDKTHQYMWTRHDFALWLAQNGFLEPKKIKGENSSNTGVIVQYGRMSPRINKWSFDCVIRKN